MRWLKSEGDQVAKGEPLYELDTDKVTQEVEAEADGVLLKIVVPEGEVDVGTTVGVIGAEGEEVAVEAPSKPSGERRRSRAEASAPRRRAAVEGAADGPEAMNHLAGERRAAATQAAAEPAQRQPGERVKASPLARRIARERGIDLATLSGTGPEGRVIAEDVEKAAAAPAKGRRARRCPGRGRGRAAHLDPQDDRAPADRGLGGARLPAHRRRRRDRARRDARAAGRAHARGRREADRQRRADAARRERAHAAPAGQRAIRRGRDPPLPDGERRHRGRDAERARRPGRPRRAGEVRPGHRRRPCRSRRPRPRGQAPAPGPRGRDLHDLEPRDVRHRPVRRRPQPAAGRDPGGRLDRGTADRRRRRRSWSLPR